MNERLIKKTIYEALCACYGSVPVILADQNEPRPPRPYLTFKLITGPLRLGHDVEAQDQYGMTFTGLREMTVSLNYYGQLAVGAMATIQTRLQYPSVRAILKANKLVYVTDSGVRDVSQLLETQTETRAQMDVTLRATLQDVDSQSGWIDEVEIEDTDTEGVFLISDGGA